MVQNKFSSLVSRYFAFCTLAALSWLAMGKALQAQVRVVNGISTVAGSGTACSPITAVCGDGGAATSANFTQPYYVAFDSAGNMYIADTGDHRVRKVNASTGVITTVAGTGTVCSSATSACGDGGPATSANFNSPRGIVLDAVGNLYIADYNDQRIRKVDTAGNISTYAGTGTICSTATAACGDGGLATAAQVRNPYSVALDSTGNLYIADLSDNRIRKVDATTGYMSTFAGTGTTCGTPTGACGDGGSPTSANIASPTGVYVDQADNLYIAENGASKIRKITASTGLISTIAGTGTAGFTGDGGAATSARLSSPAGLAVDRAGNVYIADYSNVRIRRIDGATGVMSTVAGVGTTSFSGDGGPAASANIGSPYSVAVDALGNLYIPDRTNHRIRKVAPSTFFSRTAMGGATTQNVLFTNTSALNITGISAAVSQGSKQEFTVGAVTGCTVDASGGATTPAGSTCVVPVTFAPGYAGQRLVSLVVATTAGSYKLGLSGVATGPQVAITPGVVSTVAGNGSACSDPSAPCGDGAAATAATTKSPYGSAVDAHGNIYFADAETHRVRRVDADTGAISTIAGTGISGNSGDGALAINATLTTPRGITVDAANNVYVADFGANVVRRIDGGTGLISTVAGNGTACSTSTGACGDGAAATSANLNAPFSTAFDSVGNLYIADYGNHKIREVFASNGLITTIAGTGASGNSGDGAFASLALLNGPAGIAFDTSGNLFIADVTANVIRKVEPFRYTITTIAGNGSAASSGDGALATNAALNAPIALVTDGAGNLYIATNGGNRIRRINVADGIITSVAGTGSTGSAGDGGPSTRASFNALNSIAIDGMGNLYVADSGNYKLRKVDVSGGTLAFATTTIIGDLDSADGAQTATIANIGNSSLTFAVPSTGSNPSVSSSFTWNAASTCPQLSPLSATATLAGGATCTVAVDFIPAASGAITGSVVTTDDALNVAGSTQTTALHGTGISAADAGDLTTTVVAVSPGSISFGQSATVSAIVTPATSTTSPVGSVTFTDTFGASIVTLGDIPLSGGRASLSFTPTFVGTHVITAAYRSSDITAFRSSSDTAGKTLSITQVSPIITVNAVTIPYGTVLRTLSASIAYEGSTAPTGRVTFAVDGGTPVTAACTGVSSPLTCQASYSTAAIGVGTNHVISVTSAADTNYTAGAAIGTLTVIKATPALTVTPVTINVGSSPTTLTASVSYTGALAPTGTLTLSVNGGTSSTATCTGTASPLSCTASYLTSTLVSGNYTVAAAMAADTNYNAATATGTLTSTAQDFSFVTAGSNNISATGGSSASFTYTLTPVGNIYPSSVSFTVAGLPSSATYSFSPATVGATDGSKTITLTIQTTTSMVTSALQPAFSWSKGVTVSLGFLVLPFFFRRKIRGGIVLSALLVLTSLCATTMLSGCGSKTKASGTSYTVVVNATSGSVQKRIGTTLTVK